MIKTLGAKKALSEGSSLWALPHLKQSSWSLYLDWHLNFQLFSNKESKKELLILSKNILPNEKTLIIPLCLNDKKWIHTLHTVWEKLNKPSLRVFLPETFTKEQFKKLWEKYKEKKSLEIVIEKNGWHDRI